MMKDAHNADYERSVAAFAKALGLTSDHLAALLESYGLRLIRAESWRLRSDFDVVPRGED